MPTWFEHRVLDLVRKLTDVYYQRKYGAMARRLGRDSVSADHRRGFILLQVDGLSHFHLLRALENGYLPYLNRLMSSARVRVAPWRCGVPSSTPAVQAGMMFGNRFDIPGFRWFEKDRRAAMSPQRLDQIAEMHRRISDGKPGILSGGSCYVSMFDGDAELALFTLSTLRRQRFFESMRGVGFLVLFLLSPLRVLRVLTRAVIEYGNRIARSTLTAMRALAHRRRADPRDVTPGEDEISTVNNPLDLFSPLVHAFSDALFLEVQTFGVMLDIYRRAPAIYANYNGYDEVAHELGPAHPAAFQVLKRIDKRIRQIDRMRANYRAREYDLYIVSDHGNSPAVPFRLIHGMTLGDHIAAGLNESASVVERIGQHTYAQDRARYLREELRVVEEGQRSRFQNLAAAARRYLDQIIEDPDTMDYDLKRQQDIVVSASGSLAHIYFNVAARPLDTIEVLLLYPDLLDWLIESEGIGAVIGRAAGRTVVLGRGGGTLNIGETADLVEPPDPLEPFGDAGYAAKQIHRLAHFPHAGDLILLGEMREDGRAVTFETQVSTHGGLGGPQTEPFIAWPAERELNPAKLDDAEDLYSLFRGYAESTP